MLDSKPKITIDKFAEIILKCWSFETTRLPQLWREDQPSIGQSLQTAFIVQEFMGGTVVGGLIGNFFQYWNVLPNGLEIDFSREHFGPAYQLIRYPKEVKLGNVYEDEENPFTPQYAALRRAFIAHLEFEGCNEVQA